MESTITKRHTVRKGKVISDDSDGAGVKVVTIDLVSQTRNGTEVLEVSIEGIGEVQVTVPGVDTDVVEGVELATKVVVEEG